MASTRLNKLLRKYAVLKNGVQSVSTISSNAEAAAKDKNDRKKFWSEMMETAEKPGDRLKASELLGRSEADFTDKLGLGGIGEDDEITEIPIIFVKPQPQKQLTE